MSDKEKAEIVLPWFVGRSRANDVIYQGELIDKNDITNKISDVSNAAVNESDTSFIEQYGLGNTYDRILTLAKEKKANHGKAVVRAKRNCQKTVLFVSDVSVL